VAGHGGTAAVGERGGTAAARDGAPFVHRSLPSEKRGDKVAPNQAALARPICESDHWAAFLGRPFDPSSVFPVNFQRIVFRK
jgi:hypothetical protein